MKNILEKLVNRKNLSSDEIGNVFSKMLAGELSDVLISAFLVGLRSKGETIDEIFDASKIMREFSVKINPKIDSLLDTCGTGGDSLNTFNISTTCSFVVAGAGIAIAKHGNRSNSGPSGSSDVLSALGVNLDNDPNLVERCIEDIGIGFLFAPHYHKSMKHVAGIRKQLAIRTIFNILGPLTNPAGAKYQLIGVFSKQYLRVFAEVLKRHGSVSAMIVCGHDGMDEITLTGKTDVCFLKDGIISEYEIDPLDFGFDYCNFSDLFGGSPKENADTTRGILSGEIKGARRNIVLLNSAAGLLISGKVSSIKEGILLAGEIIDNGMALEKLEQLIGYN